MPRQTDRQFCDLFLKVKTFLHYNKNNKIIKIVNYLIPLNRGSPRLRPSL